MRSLLTKVAACAGDELHSTKGLSPLYWARNGAWHRLGDMLQKCRKCSMENDANRLAQMMKSNGPLLATVEV
eukprot:6212549-Pleurochrysis_carterae.AAC.4